MFAFYLSRAADTYNQELLAQINHSGKMHMIPSLVNGKYVIRFCVTYEHATEKDIGKLERSLQPREHSFLLIIIAFFP